MEERGMTAAERGRCVCVCVCVSNNTPAVVSHVHCLSDWPI